MPRKKPQSHTPIKPDAYLSFVQSIKLQGVGLDNASVDINRIALAQAVAAKHNILINMDANFTVLNRADDSFITSARFDITEHVEGSNEKLVRISCSFSALFNLSTKARADFTDRFARSEAKLVFWPYLRHFVADISYRMSITPILIPLTSETNGDDRTEEKESGMGKHPRRKQ